MIAYAGVAHSHMCYYYIGVRDVLRLLPSLYYLRNTQRFERCRRVLDHNGIYIGHR